MLNMGLFFGGTTKYVVYVLKCIIVTCGYQPGQSTVGPTMHTATRDVIDFDGFAQPDFSVVKVIEVQTANVF